MSRIVLDTNALIWLVSGSTNLGTESKQLVNQAVSDNDLFVSAMSFWEVGVLVAKGRMLLYVPMFEWRRFALDLGMAEVPVTGDIAMISTAHNGLPNDPADRIITTTRDGHWGKVGNLRSANIAMGRRFAAARRATVTAKSL